VHVRKPGRPTPAFVLAAIALFVSLGGTGYAARTLTAGPSHHAQSAATKSKTLTAAQVDKLIGSYIAKHHLSLRGPAGPAGPAGGTGPTGGTGPAGPGAAAALKVWRHRGAGALGACSVRVQFATA
jgi:hypothetical protein